jgi:cell division protein FtsQ
VPRQYRIVHPSKKERKLFPSPIFVLATMVVLIISYGFYRFANYLINETEMFELKNIKIVGNKYLEEEEILSLSEIKTGVNLFDIETDSVASKILKNKYFEGVSINRSLPSSLIISVQERQPVAYLIDGNIYMVDQTAIILLKKPSMPEYNLPIITGLSVPNLLADRTPLLEVLDLLSKVKKIDPELVQFISEIHSESKAAPCFYLIRGGAKVDLGYDSIHQKIYILSEFIKSNGMINQLDKIKKIDLKFTDRVVVTKKS